MKHDNLTIDIFGAQAEMHAPEKPKRRDVDAEARSLLAQTGISALPKEAKQYVLATLIANHFPELQNVMALALVRLANIPKNPGRLAQRNQNFST